MEIDRVQDDIPIFICRTGWTGVWVREIIPVHWKGKATDCG